jgi:hypothetical protein
MAGICVCEQRPEHLLIEYADPLLLPLSVSQCSVVSLIGVEWRFQNY